MKEQTKPKLLTFSEYPDFGPNLTPQQIFKFGSFGGTYFRPIYSSVINTSLRNQHKEFDFLNPIPKKLLINKTYQTDVNSYGVRVGTSLEFWESKGWITKFDPYGWAQWYCRFYSGRRCEDDERQIRRWKKTAGPKSRFRARLINMVKKKETTFDDFSVSPKIRQVLQHWGYQLVEEDIK